MSKLSAITLLLSLTFATAQPLGFAWRVTDYEPGTDPAQGFNHPEAALGQPTEINPFGDDVIPFNPPYSPRDIVSIGTGGSITLEFRTPILDHPRNPYGLDFMVFGNSGFVITNEFDFETFEWIGTPATDGSLFGATDGETRVSVSRDGTHFLVLDPSLTPTVDQLLPTDSYGDPHTPAFPGFVQEDFAGLTEADAAILYGGSAGGAGFDISWARDHRGNPVKLQQVRFVRIEVLSGRAEIDAVAATFAPPGLSRK